MGKAGKDRRQPFAQGIGIGFRPRLAARDPLMQIVLGEERTSGEERRIGHSRVCSRDGGGGQSGGRVIGRKRNGQSDACGRWPLRLD